MPLTREDMRRIAIEDYFGTVAADRIPETLAFFEPDAEFTIFPSARLFKGHARIAAMFGEVFARHPVIRREILSMAIDPEAGIMAAAFRALVPGKPLVMHNVNFWRFSGRRFAEVRVFSSDPAL